jgi:hypothetical protein
METAAASLQCGAAEVVVVARAAGRVLETTRAPPCSTRFVTAAAPLAVPCSRAKLAVV